jgi:hypothetical protein
MIYQGKHSLSMYLLLALGRKKLKKHDNQKIEAMKFGENIIVMQRENNKSKKLTQRKKN